MNTVCLVIGIAFVFVGGVLFLGYGISSVVCSDVKYMGVAIVGVIILFFGICGLFIYTQNSKIIKDNTDKEYQKLLKNVDIANKELQKFYIDHPEYKLEEKEND